MWIFMRARLIIYLIISVAVGFVAGVLFSHKPSIYDPRPFIGYELISAYSMNDLENKFNQHGFSTVKRHEVANENSHFVFYVYYPYRGVPYIAVYCYEQIKSDTWVMRGFFPVNLFRLGKTVRKEFDGDELDYRLVGDSLEIVSDGRVLVSIKRSDFSRQP